MIKPHLQSLHSLRQHPKADLYAIVDNEKVCAIPVALASDGTALKPGLEYDSRQKQVIDLTYKVDEKFVKKHPLPDPEKIKTSLINNADVIIATSLDNGAAMPVAVNFRPKSVTGEEIFSCMEDSIRTIQTCQNCLKGQRSVKHIVTSEASMSKCEECLKAKSVCASCKNMGQVSHHPSLRACDSSSDRNVTCQKLVVMAVATDCKECNKKALVCLSDMADGKELPPELELVVPLPDVVHIGKSFKCSWSNWFINLDGEFSNLVLLRSLRNNAEVFIKKKLRKLLSLKCVRNKDRMAVEPIIRLTRPEVLKVLEDVKFVVHTIVPEQYRFWKSNQRGVCPHPIAVSEGPTGSILALDYNFETGLSRLLTIRLHQPADVSVVRDGLKDARNLCFIDGIAFLCERGKSTISFVDFEGKVKISTKSLKQRAELLRHLEALSLPTDGTVPVLRERLKDHLF